MMLLVQMLAMAEHVSLHDAQQKGAEFLLSKNVSLSRSMMREKNEHNNILSMIENVESCDAYYVFNMVSQGGYVIVSADDRMPTVLGYSETGHYDKDNMPDNMKKWMNGYVEQYSYLQANSNKVTGANTTSVIGAKIIPMLTCQWGQETPYNNMCPTIDGQKSATGCVATAMAQIMDYYQWPNQTSKTIPSYTSRSHGIYMPEIGVTSINWDNMNQDEIAKLMKLCGCAVQMNYGLGASGATSIKAKEAFIEFFDYKEISIKYIDRSDFSDEIWNQMMYDELSEGRPVLYSGTSNSGGHAFVVDGYDGNDYFHINWGWEGYQDSYFLLSSLNGYNEDQDAIIGIEGKNTHIDRQYPYAMLYNGTLTFYCDNNDAAKEGIKFTIPKNRNNNWTSYNYNSEIKQVVFDPSFYAYKRLYDLSAWFNHCTNLTTIEGLEYINTEKVTDMSSMFNGCSSLQNIDFSKLNTQNVSNMSSMFNDCSSLVKIDLSKLNTQNV